MIKRLMRNLVIISLFISIFLIKIPFAFAGTGFLGGPMWVSPESPSDGDSVNLSALFHNAEPNSLSGNVMFYDGNVLLGQKNISIASGGVSTATVTFRVSSGDHTFSATIGNLVETLSSGSTEPFALSPQTVRLPTIFVPSKAGDNLTASVVSNATNFPSQIFMTGQISPSSPLAPVVDQVNQLKGSVISSIPDSVKSPLGGAVLGMEIWRANNANVFDKAKQNSTDAIQKIKTAIVDEQKKTGKIPFSKNYIDQPFEYVKLFFFTLMSFLYSHAIVFYLSLALFLYIIFKYLFNKISSMRKKPQKPKAKINSRAYKVQD